MSADPFRYRQTAALSLNDAQLATFQSIADIFLAPLSREEEDALVQKFKSTHSEEDVRRFCRMTSSSLNTLPSVFDYVDRTVLSNKKQELSMVLSLLTTKAGTFALTGHFCEFKDIPPADKEKVMLSWKDSYIPQLRLLYKTFHTLTCHPAFSMHSELGDCMKHNTVQERVFEEVPEKLPMLRDIEDNARYDVIVVGSGAGGGVIACQMAKAGKSVLVIEKGEYVHELEFGIKEGAAFRRLYENGGASPTLDGAVNMLAGSVFGGGTTVNWCASLKLQHFVREEWAKNGLSYFLTPKFAKDLDLVYERIGATTDGIEHNGSNQVLVDGCRVLGYPVADIPQNTSGKAHACENCYAGCRGGIKNGTMNTWLRDAYKQNAKFLPKSKVSKVIIKDRKAVGVECIVNYKKKVSIYADKVVVSAGSLQTPGVLLRSGLNNNNIGKHLKIHPCSITFGWFDRPIRTFEGSIMTAVSTVAENVDNEGYGAKLEVPCLPPGNYSSVIPWLGSANFKEKMLSYESAVPIIILCRDRDSKGSVHYDDEQNQIVEYALSKHDRQSILAGIVASLNVLVAAGARELQTGQFGVDPFVFSPNEESRIDNPKFIAWREKVIKYGLPDEGLPIFCAHQMGTSRMGISPKLSVTKPTGETWEVKDLYVGDASLLPTATGVNPMVTIEATCLHVADCMLNDQPSKL
ncbi:hypothetical protein BDB01DRAFT_896260 [Pilobolus umbonatus]|nr:hypothetical protein BDB01DRAFT_896260 [Pilobolus umbonatus]